MKRFAKEKRDGLDVCVSNRARSAFTMIELVFIIVILGILAVVALPRLAATRDDAKMSVLAQNTMTGAWEIAAYAVAKRHTEQDLSAMSNAIEKMVQRGEAIQSSTSPPTLQVPWGGVQDCVVLRIDGQGGNTEVLNILANGAGSNAVCDRFRSLIDTQQFPIPLRGTTISR